MGVLSLPALFGILFVVIILCVACLAMAIYVKTAAMRILFVLSALALGLMLALLCWTEFSMQNRDVPEAQPKQEEQKEKKKPKPTGTVELKIDESTIPKDEGTLKNPERLALEKGAYGSGNSEVQEERRRIGRLLSAVEQSLGNKLHRLDIRSQEIRAAYDRGLLDNYDTLTKQSQIKQQQAEFIVQAMQDKLDILAGAKILSQEELEPDRRRIEARLMGARKKSDEYKNVLAQLNTHTEVFQSL